MLWPIFFYDFLDIIAVFIAVTLIISGIILIITSIEQKYFKISIVISVIFFFLHNLYYLQDFLSIIANSFLNQLILWQLGTFFELINTIMSICYSFSLLYILLLFFRKKSTQEIIIFFLSTYFLTHAIQAGVKITHYIIESLIFYFPLIEFNLAIGLMIYGAQALYSSFGIRMLVKSKTQEQFDLAKEFDPLILVFFIVQFFLTGIILYLPVLTILNWLMNWIILALLVTLGLFLFLFKRNMPIK